MIIDTTYFTGQLSIPQSEQVAVKAVLQQYIEQYEPEYLRKLLGEELLSVWGNGAGAPYAVIKNGIQWMDMKGYRKWPGLKIELLAAHDAVPATYASPITNYVYFKYMMNTATAAMGTGDKVVDAQNARSISIWPRLCRAWNEMVDVNRELYDFLDYNSLVYPEWYTLRRKRMELFEKLNPIF